MAPDGSITIPGMGGRKLTRARDLGGYAKIATLQHRRRGRRKEAAAVAESVTGAGESEAATGRAEPLAPPASFGAGLSDHSQSDYEEAEQLKAQGNDLLARPRPGGAEVHRRDRARPGRCRYHANWASAYIASSPTPWRSPTRRRRSSDPNYVKGYRAAPRTSPRTALPRAARLRGSAWRVPNTGSQGPRQGLQGHRGARCGGDLGGGGGGGAAHKAAAGKSEARETRATCRVRRSGAPAAG